MMQDFVQPDFPEIQVILFPMQPMHYAYAYEMHA